MNERDRKIFRKVLVGRQNVHIYLKWAAVLLTLRTTDLNNLLFANKGFYFKILREKI